MKNYLILAFFCMNAATAAVAAAQPALSLSANHGIGVELPKGWPLLVTGILFPSEDLNNDVIAAPLIIDPPSGASWADAIQLLVTAADGSEKAWKLKPAGRAENRVLELTERDFVTFGWTLSPVETASLSTGEYVLVARLALEGTPGWNGEVTSPAVTINAIEPPTVLDEANAAEKALLNARYEIAAGSLSGAASAIDQLLANYPSNARGLLMQSQILEAQGKQVQAWVAAQKSLAAAYEEEPFPKEPPFSLILREQELATSFAGPQLAAAWISGVLQLTLSGNRGSSYKIETSSTLANWSPALNVTISDENGVVAFPAPTTNGDAYRFYRAVRSP